MLSWIKECCLVFKDTKKVVTEMQKIIHDLNPHYKAFKSVIERMTERKFSVLQIVFKKHLKPKNGHKGCYNDLHFNVVRETKKKTVAEESEEETDDLSTGDLADEDDNPEEDSEAEESDEQAEKEYRELSEYLRESTPPAVVFENEKETIVAEQQFDADDEMEKEEELSYHDYIETHPTKSYED